VIRSLGKGARTNADKRTYKRGMLGTLPGPSFAVVIPRSDENGTNLILSLQL
jgi:hypothetical protein